MIGMFGLIAINFADSTAPQQLLFQHWNIQEGLPKLNRRKGIT